LDYISVELANEAGEVVVLEIFRKQILGESGGVPDDEGRSRIVPRNDIVDGVIVDELVGFGEKRRGNGSLRVTARGNAVVFERRSHGMEGFFLL